MTRLLAAIALLLAIALAPNGRLLGALAIALLLLVSVARVGGRLSLRVYAKRLLLLEPLMLGLVVAALGRGDGGATALRLLVRGSLSVAVASLLAATTKEAELLRALERLKLPRLLVTSLALAARYRPLVSEEAMVLTRARRSRSFARSRRDTWRGAAEVVGQLFVRASLRAERLHRAMLARGWRE